MLPEPIEFARRLPKQPGDPTVPCEHAQRFAGDAGAVLDDLTQKIGKVPADQRQTLINQTKVIVYDLYRRDRSKAIPPHKNSQGRQKHRCLPEALDQVGDRIDAIERQWIEKRINLTRTPARPAPPDPQGSPLADLLNTFGKPKS